MKNPKKTTATDGEIITIKEERKHNYIIVYDTIYKNNDLSIDELALIIKLLGMAPTFKPTTRGLANILKIDHHRLIKATKGLQDKGYLIIKKHGQKSEWIIKQEPSKINLNELTKENLVNRLMNFDMSYNDLKTLHKLKYIDDKLFIETSKKYTEEIQKTIKTKWLED